MKKMKPLVYLDHAATTPLKQEVVNAMLPYFSECYGNPSALYGLGEKSRNVITEQRKMIAKTLGTKGQNIYFTSGGTESDNWAIKSVAEQYRNRGNHIITSKIEHHAVLRVCEYLETKGYEVTYIDVDKQGKVDLEQLQASIRPTTILISIMYANNEVGTIQPIKDIGRIAKKCGIIFHTDAVQAYGQLDIDVEKEHIDLLSVSGHKIFGPKGIGFLYVGKDVKIGSWMHGGSQERQKRAGTENVAGIVGIGRAAEIAYTDRKRKNIILMGLRDYLIQRIEQEIPYVFINGSRKQRLPNNISVCIPFVEAETVLALLDAMGICVSVGSACTSRQTEASHVLLAMGMNENLAHNVIRMTLGEENTKEEVDFVVDKLRECVERLRRMSPNYEKFC